MKDFVIEKIIKEWSYRIERGYPRVEKPEDLNVLREILTENYGSKFAENYIQNIQESLDEVALGLNNSSLRHKNRHEKYIKRLIKTLKKGREVKLENTVEYTDEAEENSKTVKIPAGEEVEVDSQDEMIGKVVLNLKKVLKYGPEFPEENEEAQKALKQVEEFFTYDDGTYRRVVPVKVKDRKILLKLNDISKDTVTREEDEEETNNPELKKSKEKKKKKKAKAKMKKKKGDDEDETSDLSLDLGENVEKGESEDDDKFSLPDGVVELFGDTYNDGNGKNHATGEDLTGDQIGEPDVTEDSEDEDETGEGHHDDAPSKYVDRRRDGKDTKYPDREYREFDPESDEEEEEKDDDYRHDKGDEEDPPEDENTEQDNEENDENQEEKEGDQEGEEKQVEESYKFKFNL